MVWSESMRSWCVCFLEIMLPRRDGRILMYQIQGPSTKRSILVPSDFYYQAKLVRKFLVAFIYGFLMRSPSVCLPPGLNGEQI